MMHTMPPEVWRPVPSRGRLEASSHGRIRVPPRTVPQPYGGERTCETRPTFGSITSSSKGARHVFFSRHIKAIGHVKVHRAVCEAFHGPSPFDRAVVIHINENSLDNRPENLRWGTQKENLNSPGFIAYARRANKAAARKDGRELFKTADIYFGLPHLVEEIRKRAA